MAQRDSGIGSSRSVCLQSGSVGLMVSHRLEFFIFILSLNPSQLMKMNRNTLFVILIAAISSAAGVGYAMWNKPHEDLTEEPADFTLTSTDLYTAYSSDEAAANESYLGKTVEITGTIAEKKEEEGNRAIVLLEIPGEMFGINCAFEADQSAALQKTEPGQSVTLRGKVDGFTLDVNLSRCVLIQ